MRLFLAVLVGCCMHGFASSGQIDAESAKKHVIVKFAPLALFDFDNSVQFGVEVPLGNSGMSVQQDFGYGHSSFNLWYSTETERPRKETYKSRTQLRYYYLERRRYKAYVAGEFLLKKVIYSENKWVGMECEQPWGNCGYFENKFVKTGRTVGAGHVKMGWQFYFGNRMALDVFTGLGFRSISVKSITPTLENTRIPRTDRWFEYDTPGTSEVVPSLAMGFHFGIILGKFDD
ncbi:DUF3575 domain-containing protein [Dyadobacter sp. CY107]|uniref:DUF3575 domain-containing protein n=1 Tax=Dyadobacter fanqingshengii TaxID=2906443 RepID=UPI001F2F0E28|nr:DUF3575 domain-containing protein [Dyadobacter fanqingshengii]MCF2504791.1 DUF3575 domain-containing protein [Dyadobacter fanqingshengii]